VILTVTLNPALDLTYAVDALVPYGTHRVASVAERAGGKGLNVARVLHGAGQPVLATGLLGGATGARVTALLRDAGLRASFVPIAGETRRTVAVTDHEDATGFWEPGPRVTPAEWAAFLAHFRELLGDAEVVALCGSLPPGVPVDGYARLIRLAAGARTVLDTGGEPLRLGLAAGPDVAKPNAGELAALLDGDAPDEGSGAPDSSGPDSGGPDSTGPGGVASGGPGGVAGGGRADAAANGRAAARDELADATRARSFGARAVVVSHGPRGLIAVTGDGAWRCTPPERVAGNPTGAGDACVAALARGLRAGTGWPALLADAVALSAAAVAAPVAGAVDEDTYRRTLPRVTVTAIPGGIDVHTDR
jgi:tagatose 6-phosphate kinase